MRTLFENPHLSQSAVSLLFSFDSSGFCFYFRSSYPCTAFLGISIFNCMHAARWICPLIGDLSGFFPREVSEARPTFIKISCMRVHVNIYFGRFLNRIDRVDRRCTLLPDSGVKFLSQLRFLWLWYFFGEVGLH